MIEKSVYIYITLRDGKENSDLKYHRELIHDMQEMFLLKDHAVLYEKMANLRF